MESDAQLVSSEFPIGVRLGSDQETYLATESLSPCSSSEICEISASLWDGCSSIFFKCLYHFCYSILTDK